MASERMTLVQTSNYPLGGWPCQIRRSQQRPQIRAAAGSWLPPVPRHRPATASQHAVAVAEAATTAADQRHGEEGTNDMTAKWQRGSPAGDRQQLIPMISRRRMLLHAGALAAAPGMCACCPGVAVASDAWSYGANVEAPRDKRFADLSFAHWLGSAFFTSVERTTCGRCRALTGDEPPQPKGWSPLCSTGTQQSPVDIPYRTAAVPIATAANTVLGPIQLFDYGWTECRVVNTGHGLQVGRSVRSV